MNCILCNERYAKKRRLSYNNYFYLCGNCYILEEDTESFTKIVAEKLRQFNRISPTQVKGDRLEIEQLMELLTLMVNENGN